MRRGLTRLRHRPVRVHHPVCHDLKAWVASTDGGEYSVLDPAFTTTRPMPRTIEAEVDDSFAPLCSFPVPERALVAIPHGRIRGEFGLVVLPDGSFAGELVAMTPAGRHLLLEAEPSYFAPLPAEAVRRSGNYLAVLGLGVPHYYHWSHDIIMRLRGLAGRLPPDTQLIVPERMQPFQTETLALLGLDDHPRVPFPAGEFWQLDKLHVVTPTLKTQIDHAEPYRWFREAVMRRYGLRDVVPTRRLFLSRQRDNHWRATNQTEVEQVLARYGFETVVPAAMTLREQAELFGQAGVIIGTGAGLMNMVFSPPGTQILQFQESGHMVHALWTMASALEFDYHYFLCEAVPNADHAINDLRVPVEKLEASLAAMAVSCA